MIAPRWGIPSAAARRMWKPCRRSSPRQRPVGRWPPREADQGGTSGATVLMGVVRLGTIAAAMVALSPLLSLVAALAVVPVVLVTRYFQVRVRDAERASRQAVGLQNTHLQEMLGGVEVIRALGSEAAFIARFRAALRDGLAAHNRATVYSALYIPLMVILSTLAMALVLWVGVAGQGMLAALDISLGTLTAFVLLLQRFFVPIMSLGNEWQTVQAALAGLERIFQVLALPSEAPAPGARASRNPGATPPSRCGRWSLATCPTARCCVACRWRRSQGSTSSWWDGLAPGRAASYTCWADSTPRGAGHSGCLAPTPPC